MTIAIVALVPVAPVLAEQPPAVHGVSPVDMDFSIDPAVDFCRFANGGWLDRIEIPPDLAGVEAHSDLVGRTRFHLVQLLTERAAEGDTLSESHEWKVTRLFEQGLDLSTRIAQGIEPIQGTFEEIDAIDDLDALHRFFLGSVCKSVPGFFFVAPGPDLKDSSVTVAYLYSPVLSLPSRDYYGEGDATTIAPQEALFSTSAGLLVLSGREERDARQTATAVLELERSLAETTLLTAEVRDPLRARRDRPTGRQGDLALPAAEGERDVQPVEQRDHHCDRHSTTAISRFCG